MSNLKIVRPGVELLPSGDERGLDPRDLSPADLEALNHQAMPASKAIRLHCVECSGGSAVEARMCVTVGCSLWPFRLGVSPWKAERQFTEEQREAARERGQALARKSDARVGAAVNLTGNLEGSAGAGISASHANSSPAISGRAA